MVKRLILFILATVILLTSCTWTNVGGVSYRDKRILSRIERTYARYKGYKCKADINIISDDEKAIYQVQETYYKPNRYKLEILKPKESKGIIILNTDDKIFLEHASIKQSISLVTIKSLNKQLLIGGFFENVYMAKRLENEKIDKTDYLVFQYRFQDGNIYRESAKVWLNKRTLTPHKLSIYGSGGVLRVEILYHNFKFLRIARRRPFRINIFRR